MRIGHACDFDIRDEDIQAFYRAEWDRRLAFENDAFFRWQFRRPPANEGKNYCCVAIDDQGRLAGVMGLNRRPFLLDGKLLDAAELTTWATAKAHHGGAVGGRILQFLLKNYPVMFGAGISHAALPLYLRSGFRYLRALPRMIRVYRPAEVAAISTLDANGAKLLQHFSQPPRAAGGPFKVEEIAAGEWAPGSADANQYDRSLQSLKWRYAEHPLFEYRCFRLVPANSPPILVILRQMQYGGIAFCHVMEILSTVPHPLEAVDFLDAFSAENGLAFADFFGTRSSLNACLAAGGWISAIDDTFIRVPHLFMPLEIREPPTTSLIYRARDHMESLADIGRLYLTKGDMDLDRPTAHAQSVAEEGTGR
jgi:hypothetical protein